MQHPTPFDQAMCPFMVPPTLSQTLARTDRLWHYFALYSILNFWNSAGMSVELLAWAAIAI